MKLELKSSKTFSDKSGSLVPFYKKESLANFNINRFFYIYGHQKYSRADHAHKKCNQILIPISGKIEVEVTNKKKIKKKFLLTRNNNKYVIIPKEHWIKLKFKEKNSVLLTICDFKYLKEEYIQSKEEFFKRK